MSLFSEPSEKGILVHGEVKSSVQHPAKHQVVVQLKDQGMQPPEPELQRLQQEEEEEPLYYKEQSSKHDHSFNNLMPYISSVCFICEMCWCFLIVFIVQHFFPLGLFIFMTFLLFGHVTTTIFTFLSSNYIANSPNSHLADILSQSYVFCSKSEVHIQGITTEY